MKRPLTSRVYFNMVFKVKEKEFENLDLAMQYAKTLNEFVVIKGNDFEICGMFGVDSVKDGKTPDGVAYDWNKSSRIGRAKRSRLNPQPL
jgi:hypothetical protein